MPSARQGHAEDAGYHDYRDRYRAMAISLGYEGHTTFAAHADVA
jgi:hypothetical protein